MVSFLERQIEKTAKELKIPFLFIRFRQDVVSDSYFPNYSSARTDFDRLYLSDLLKRNNGNKAQSAREVGFSRFGLHKKLQKLNIKEEPIIFEWNDTYAYHAPSYENVVTHFERVYMHHLMVKAQGNGTAAAKIAGMSRFGMMKHARKYSIPLEEYRWMDWPVIITT